MAVSTTPSLPRSSERETDVPEVSELADFVQGPPWWRADGIATAKSEKTGRAPRETFLLRRQEALLRAQQLRQGQRHADDRRRPWYASNTRRDQLERLCSSLEDVIHRDCALPVFDLLVAALTAQHLTHGEVLTVLTTLDSVYGAHAIVLGETATCRSLIFWCCHKLDAVYAANTERAAHMELTVLSLLHTIGQSLVAGSTSRRRDARRGGEGMHDRSTAVCALHDASGLPFLLTRLYDSPLVADRAFQLLQLVRRGATAAALRSGHGVGSAQGSIIDDAIKKEQRVSMFARELCQIAAVPSLSQPTRRNASRALGLLLTVSRRALAEVFFDLRGDRDQQQQQPRQPSLLQRIAEVLDEGSGVAALARDALNFPVDIFARE